MEGFEYQMDKKQIIFLFSGHGTQYYHMGKELYENNKRYRSILDAQDDIVYQLSGRSIIKELYHKKNRKSDIFTDIRYTHLALFMVQYALAKCVIEEGIHPDYVIGTSLGEYVSITVAGILPLDSMLKFLLMQADLLHHSSSNGGMLSIIDNVEKYKNSSILDKVEIAAVNSKRNFVISGKNYDLKQIENILAKKVLYTRLDIAYSFHSSSMDVYEDVFDNYYKELEFQKPNTRIISCARCCEIDTIEKDYLWSIAREKIRFLETIQMLECQGNYCYIDMSPSGTLTNFMHDILDEVRWPDIYRIMSPYDYEEIRQYTEMIHVINHQITEREGTMKAVVFAGQGSQRVGMGKDLFDLFPELVEKSDRILGYSIKELCLENSNNLLDQTEYTQPAIYVVNALRYYKMQQDGIKADYYAGHSLGEYNALLAAGVFHFEDGLRLVKKRGALMGKSMAGGMAALIGVSKEDVIKLLDTYGITSIDMANYNSPSQIVVAGPKADLEVLSEIIQKEQKGRCIILRVSAAFHSRYMTDAQKQFSEYLSNIKLEIPKTEVIANITALPYEFDKIYETLATQINHSVKWQDSVEYMLDHGVEEFIEVGEVNTLTKLITEIKKCYVPKTVSAESKELNNQVNPDKIQNDVTIERNVNQTKNNYLEAFTNKEFMEDYGVLYPYVIGGMYHGISSVDMVVRAAKTGFLAFFGTGGLSMDDIRLAVKTIQSQASRGAGFNFTPNYFDEDYNEKMIDLFIEHQVSVVEASGFIRMLPALVRYRLHSLREDNHGRIIVKNKVIAKLSRPEIAELFMNPAPKGMVSKLLSEQKITESEAKLAERIPMADDICVEQDSGGHTDQGSAFVLLPTLKRMVMKCCEQYHYDKKIRVGLGGGIGTPEAMATAFFMGAQFVVTGSINQCTVEAGISDLSKELLAEANIQDTEYAPAGDMFEIGAKVQVLKKGVFFPARANRLYEAYKFYDSIQNFDSKLRNQIEKFYFEKSLEQVYEEVKQHYITKNPGEIDRAEKNEKYKMALILKQYFRYATNAAIEGNESKKANFQILCGSSMGAFNQWISSTAYSDFKKRHVDEIGLRLIEETEAYLQKSRY